MDFSGFKIIRELFRPKNSGIYDEEIANETSISLQNNNTHNSYSSNGVYLGNESNIVKLKYDGILAKGGAENVCAVVGHGSNQKWDNIEYYPMRKIGNEEFELLFQLKDSGNINIAFTDYQNNWDNNSGENYIFSEDSF